MKHFYMDTNVFVSRLKPDDQYHSEAKIIFKGLEKDEIRSETSVLTLLEVASVSGRLYRLKRRSEKEKRVFIVRALRRLARVTTKFINIAGDAPLSIKGIQAILPSMFNEAILLSLQTNLRTFDLIHLASARHAKRMNDELGAFVTGDKEFLVNKKELAELIGMPIFSPREYTKGMRL